MHPLDSQQQPPVNLKMVTVPAIKGHMQVQFRTLIATVMKITGFNIEIEETATYQEAIEMLHDQTAQMGWLGAEAYLEGAHYSDIEAFAVATRGEALGSTYRTIFLTLADSEIKTLADLPGKQLAFSQKGSTSGDIMPYHELVKQGMDPKSPTRFPQIVYTGAHESSITAIISGAIDAAAVSDINFEALVLKGLIDRHKFKIIHTSASIPGAPLVYSKKLALGIREKLKAAVLSAHQHGDVSGYGENIVKYQSHEAARQDFLHSYLKPQWSRKTLLILTVMLFVIVGIMIHLRIDPIAALTDASKYILDLLSRLLPPDFSKPMDLLLAMVETIEIGVLGTVLAIMLALPLGLLSAKNISPHGSVYFVSRVITIFFRAIPEFIMAMILVIAVGFGALPGVLALGFHTMGFLAKFYAEGIEHVDTGPIEALEATGASKYQIILFAIIPQLVPTFVGFTLYILDRNIRMATMLGIVGAGGIGYLLQTSFRMFEYRKVSAIIIIIFVTIYLIDVLSAKLRQAVI